MLQYSLSQLLIRIDNRIDYMMIELTFLKELMLIKHVHQKSVIFVTIGIS